MSTWPERLDDFQCGELFSGRVGEPHSFEGKEWNPTDADKSAAWELYTEIRTRITTQPLAYRHGDEETALTSIYNIFGLTREAIKRHEGCTHFATLAVHVLNVHIRPFTAYWHKVMVAGRLSSSDTCHRFRRELAALQGKLRLFMRLLGHLAEGDDFKAGTESGIEAAVVYPEYDLGDAIAFGVTGSRMPINNAADIDKAERPEVLARRANYGLPATPEDAVGLAISGGGIRSATFSLGVVQYLARKGIIKSVDFVSTVSGGGYLGSFMSSYLNDPDNFHATLDPGPDSRPFGELGTVESKAVRHLRNHSKYMAEGGFKTYALAMAQMMWGIAVNLFLILPFVLGAVLVAKYFAAGAFIEAATGSLDYPASMTFLTKLIAAVLLVAALILPIVQNLGRNAGAKNRQCRVWSTRYENFCIGLFVALLALLLWNLLPLGYRLYHWLVYEWEGPKGISAEYRKALLAAAAGAGPFLAGLLQFAGTGARFVKKLGLVLLIISGPVFFLVAFFVLIDYFVVPHVMSSGASRTVLLWSLFLVVTGYGLCLNINYTSPHRYYRRQLSRTYLRRSKDRTEETEHIDPQPLSALTGGDAIGQTKAPYHFINCALNIPACDDPNLRGRNSDFFIFSKHYCGSPIAGYSATKEWEAIDGHLDLATAMSISAAAASPQMGANTDAKISYLLAILNVRLNYWVAPPRKPNDPDTLREPRWLLRMRTPGAIEFVKEMTSVRMNENSSFLNLSDGGHVENLAIYELLRRRCKFIIAIDGEADPDRTFHGLLTIVRLANIDLGVTIDPDLKDLRKIESGDSRSHFLLCKIDYGQGQQGYLLYIKSSMTGNESEFLQKYRAEHPTFPHESTADQLFDEAQFEAYRALGEHVGEDLFRRDLVDPIQPGGQPLPEKPTVREWFQGLANSLLEPEDKPKSSAPEE
jgi:hypothetical protein